MNGFQIDAVNNALDEARAEIADLKSANVLLHGLIENRDAEIERLRAAIEWTREVRPSKNKESGCAIVHMTWDQFNAMRALALEGKP